MYVLGQISERGKVMRFLAIKKETILFFLAAGIVLAAIYGWFMFKEDESTMVFNQQSDSEVREIDMITAEFESHTKDGKQHETFRWDPGTVLLEKGEKVNLYISGVGNEDHPFYIEGTDIKGKVSKGEQTLVPLQFDKKGTYRLICETHAHRDHSVPMIAYIVVN
jgi:heme/copper-type cytochrome/quinol oxidase subunit 2